jgi:hypothetical protein
MKHPNIYWFYKSLHARGEDTTTLAEAICTARTYVSRCIDGHERRGNTWQRIKRLLTVEEIELLEGVEVVASGKTEGCGTRPARSRAVVPAPCSPRSSWSEAGVAVVIDPAKSINVARPVVRAFNQWRRRTA